MTEWSWAIKFEPRDLWIGLFWDREDERNTQEETWPVGVRIWRLYFCILPMLPLVIRITRYPDARSGDRQ